MTDYYYKDTKKAIEALSDLNTCHYSDEVIKCIDDAVGEVELLLDEYENQQTILEKVYELLDDNNIDHNF